MDTKSEVAQPDEMAATIERLRGELNNNETSYEALLKDYNLVRKRASTAEAALAAARNVLSRSVFGDLPDGFTTAEMAEAFLHARIKLRDQVRDTCVRAEKAEAEARRLREAIERAICNALRHEERPSRTVFSAIPILETALAATTVVGAAPAHEHDYEVDDVGDYCVLCQRARFEIEREALATPAERKVCRWMKPSQGFPRTSCNVVAVSPMDDGTCENCGLPVEVGS